MLNWGRGLHLSCLHAHLCKVIRRTLYIHCFEAYPNSSKLGACTGNLHPEHQTPEAMAQWQYCFTASVFLNLQLDTTVPWVVLHWLQ